MKPLRDYTEWPKFACYDIEATKWVNVLCVCHMDEFGKKTPENPLGLRKFHFATVEAYADWLVSDFPGEFVWAHWGGHYDARFMLYEAFKRKWSFETVQSGNLIVIMAVTAKHKGRTRSLKFCESARIMPDSVEAIGKSIKLPKLDADRSDLGGALERGEISWDELIEYCYRDCEIVLKGLMEMRTNLKAVGIDFAFTLASMVTRYIRRSRILEPHRFYKKNPDTHKFEMLPDFLAADKFSFAAYFGGRVEVFKRGIFRDLYYYDVTSSYPYSMQFELPAYHLGTEPPCLKSNGQQDIERSLHRCGISEAHVIIPRGAMYIPLLPVRLKNKIIFPTMNASGVWTNLELLALWQRLKDVPGFSLTLGAQEVYQPMAFLKPFVELFWGLRQAAMKDPFKKYAYKIALNSCSGKLAETENKESVVFGAAYNDAREKYGLAAMAATKVPGVYVATHTARGPFRHAAAAAYVTARSRILLLEGMEQCLAMDGNVYYCDTDSIMTDVPAFEKLPKKELGRWNMEHEIEQAEIWAPKTYKLTLKPGTYDTEEFPHGVIYRAKGMPIVRREDRARPAVTEQRWNDFTAVLRGEERPKPIKEGITGLKTGLRKGRLFPEAFELKRSVQSIDTKRVHVANDSQPLHYEGSEPNDNTIATPKRAAARRKS